MPKSITFRGLKLENGSLAPSKYYNLLPTINLLFEQLVGQDAAGEDTEQMEELRDGDEDVPGADEVVLSDHRVVVGLVLKLRAGDYVGVAVHGFLPHPWLLLTVLVVVVVMCVLLRVLIYVAEVYAELLVIPLLLLRM